MAAAQLDPRRRCVEQSLREHLHLGRNIPSGPMFVLFAEQRISQERAASERELEQSESHWASVWRTFVARRQRLRIAARTVLLDLWRIRGLLNLESDSSSAVARGDEDGYYAAYASLEHWRPNNHPVYEARSIEGSFTQKSKHLSRLISEERTIERKWTRARLKRRELVLHYLELRQVTRDRLQSLRRRLARLGELRCRVRDLEIGWQLVASDGTDSDT